MVKSSGLGQLNFYLQVKVNSFSCITLLPNMITTLILFMVGLTLNYMQNKVNLDNAHNMEFGEQDI